MKWCLDGYWCNPEDATVPGLIEWIELGLRAARSALDGETP